MMELPPQNQRQRFTERAFRNQLGLFPTGVAVVTTSLRETGERLGVTVSSFNAVSLCPPLVLFSLARAMRSFPLWRRVDAFAINVLGDDQQDISDRFARSREDRWDNQAVTEGETGAPLLMDALAAYECILHARHDGGDHEIFIGQVIDISTPGISRAPLVFFGGRYCRLDATATAGMPASDSLFLQGGAWVA